MAAVWALSGCQSHGSSVRQSFWLFWSARRLSAPDVGKIGKWFDVIELAGLDQGIGDRPMTGSRFSADTDITISHSTLPKWGMHAPMMRNTKPRGCEKQRFAFRRETTR